jgi:glucokinase
VPKNSVYAAIDLGGTKIAAALVSPSGEILARTKVPTRAEEGPLPVLDRIARAVADLSHSARRRPAALGVGVPGLVDVPTGVVQFLPNLATNWRGVPAGEYLQSKLSIPVTLLNDARCATLGELVFGHCRSYSSFILFTLGTGIGGGVVIDGKLRLGPLSAAGELGHVTLDPNGPLCNCGNRGCLEALASGPAIARAAGFDNAEDAASAAREGHPQARQAFDTAAAWLGIAAANLVTALHPDAVLFSGGMSKLADLLLAPVKANVVARVRMFPPENVAIRRAQLGPDAGLLGAAALHIPGPFWRQ